MPSVLWCCWLGSRKGIRPVKNMEWWGAGMFNCLERGTIDLHMVQLMPLPSHHLLLQQNPEWFILLVPAYPGCPGKKDVKWLCVCVILTSDIQHSPRHIYFALIGEPSTVMGTSVCPHGYLQNHMTNLHQFFVPPVTLARSFSGGIAIRYILSVLWMMSRLAAMGHTAYFNTRAEFDVYKCLILKLLLLWVLGFSAKPTVQKHWKELKALMQNCQLGNITIWTSSFVYLTMTPHSQWKGATPFT